MQLYTVYFICKLPDMFRVVSPPILRSTNNCIYSIWYLPTVAATCRYRVETVQYNQISLNSSRIATGSNNGGLVPDAVDTVICVPTKIAALCTVTN